MKLIFYQSHLHFLRCFGPLLLFKIRLFMSVDLFLVSIDVRNLSPSICLVTTFYAVV